MALKVIGTGFPRTGTATLKLALEQLGFGPCHHMREVFMHPERIPLWLAAADGRPDWEAIFEGYASFTDVPGCTFWRELIEAYPDARILHSVRDPEAWFESTQQTVFSDAMLEHQMQGPLAPFFQKAVTPMFAGVLHDRDAMLKLFAEHTREVLASAPKDRILVYDVREGWAPLCAFLGVPVPDGPFPKTNTREEMHAMMAAMGDGAGFDPARMQTMMRERFGPGAASS